MGKTASAWIDFVEIAEKAHATGEAAKEAKARERAGLLEAKVGHLVIEVGAPVEGLEVKRDGVPVGHAQWGVPMPMDPGEHEIVASAPGRLPLTLKVSMPAGGTTTTARVTEPPLAPVVAAPPPAASGAPPPPVSPEGARGTGDTQRLAGWIVGGTGVTLGVVGVVVGVAAKSSYDGASGCSGSMCQTSSAVDQRNSAVSTGNAGTWLLVGGGVVAAAGVVLWLTAPTGSAAPAVGLTPAGLLARGTF